MTNLLSLLSVTTFHPKFQNNVNKHTKINSFLYLSFKKLHNKIKMIKNSASVSTHRPLSGQLYKYTNVVKGWQQRWFAVDPETGVLSYYLVDGPGDSVAPGQPARGEVGLAAAVICPSDEDSRTFSVNCASGDLLKLRAADARARQEWVDSLRAVAEIHTKALGGVRPRDQLAVLDAMSRARHQLQQTELSDAALARCVEAAEAPFSHTDTDLLLLKATSAATMQVLLQCLGVLHRQQHAAQRAAPAPDQQ